MAWTQEQPRTPTTIGKIDHFLDDLDGTNPNRSLRFFLQVLDQNGAIMRTLSGDEVPHLTQTQINQLLSFMATRRTALPVDLSFEAGNVVGRVTWRFRDGDGTVGSRSLHARVIELDAQGGFVTRHQINDQGNLTPTQVTAALTFLDTQRAKAEVEILP
jgi:hypothetical protein